MQFWGEQSLKFPREDDQARTIEREVSNLTLLSIPGVTMDNTLFFVLMTVQILTKNELLSQRLSVHANLKSHLGAQLKK